MRVKWNHELLQLLYHETRYRNIRYFQDVIRKLAKELDIKLPTW